MVYWTRLGSLRGDFQICVLKASIPELTEQLKKEKKKKQSTND